MRRIPFVLCLLVACGDDAPDTCEGPFAVGDPTGHPQPLGAGPTEARAGRISAADLPVVPSGLITWKDGDFVLANARIAIVIEDVGDSDLYDPWGGRPVGLARVEGGQLVQPNNFGELFVLTGRSTVLTDSVTVLADGSDGGPAIIRARGKLHPIPFFENLLGAVFSESWLDIDAAIDYELAPGAEHVDIRYRYSSARDQVDPVPSVAHSFMYTSRTPVYQPGRGFDNSVTGSPYIALVDEAATSWAYLPSEGTFGSSLAASGFLGAFSPGFDMPACGTLDRLHAKIVIGGPGLDGIQAAAARVRGEPQRVITGTVMRGSDETVTVHALDNATGDYLTRAATDATGAFTLHVPAGADVRLDAVQLAQPIVSVQAGAGPGPFTITMPQLGMVIVRATENGISVPARVQVLDVANQVPANYGELPHVTGRVVKFATDGQTSFGLPAGTWKIVVSRGFEYELFEQTVTVTAGGSIGVDAQLERSVATTGDVCADFHIHTSRSNDSFDDGLVKVAQAVADGVELPVRSEHEFVADFAAEIQQLNVEAVAKGMASVELSSMEIWGHMGVFPLTPDATAVNGGAPLWQTFPTAATPDATFATLTPPVVFDQVRARPEAPVIIINHPRGGANYFEYVGFDPVTGIAELESEFDTKFTLVEVFNDSGWLANRDDTVADWLRLLRSGRKVFAVGSSDSHGHMTSPVGYPRTCIALGTDDPRQLSSTSVRDALAAGHSTVSGGIYVTARVGTSAPGDTVSGAGSPMTVEVTVRAATWVDVDAVDLVVDGVTVDTIPIMPGDADPGDATIRFRKQLAFQSVAAGGFVIVAAYGDASLEPVHPGRIPFGVTNPIFVVP